MENQLNSEKDLERNETELSNPQGSNNLKIVNERPNTVEYHDYMPKHTNHGRSNSRTFGIDHEPGTAR